MDNFCPLVSLFALKKGNCYKANAVKRKKNYFGWNKQ